MNARKPFVELAFCLAGLGMLAALHRMLHVHLADRSIVHELLAGSGAVPAGTLWLCGLFVAARLVLIVLMPALVMAAAGVAAVHWIADRRQSLAAGALKGGPASAADPRGRAGT